MDGVIIGKRVRAIVGVDAVNGAECFGVIWDKPGSLLDIEGHGILRGEWRVVGVVVSQVTKRGRKKKKSLTIGKE